MTIRFFLLCAILISQYSLAAGQSLSCDMKVRDAYLRYGEIFKAELLRVNFSDREAYAVVELGKIESRIDEFESLCLWNVNHNYGEFPQEYEDANRLMRNVRLVLSLFKDLDDIGAARVISNYCNRVSRGVEGKIACED